jgi:hypothetical protein
MDAEEFVKAVREVVMHAAVDDVVGNLTKPPGRRPAPHLIELSKWFLGLTAENRDMVRRALAEASHAAVFGLFAVLDCARRVDSDKPAGELQFLYERHDDQTILNGELHELLNSESWQR